MWCCCLCVCEVIQLRAHQGQVSLLQSLIACDRVLIQGQRAGWYLGCTVLRILHIDLIIMKTFIACYTTA